jgi:4-hydroxyphenylpyruvate dioxygenase
MTQPFNPVGLRGIAFTEFCGPSIEALDALFLAFGFSKVRGHRGKLLTHYRQNDIHFLLNADKAGFSSAFARKHGPSISAMGWLVDDASAAFATAVARGARPATDVGADLPFPAIFGIGDSLIYFVEGFDGADTPDAALFEDLAEPVLRPNRGFLRVDHLTNNVAAGTMGQWADFYKGVFGFTEVRYFDINGVKTGLTSYALRSPDGSFCIPINEPKSETDQIAEYLREYDGPGVQHLAFQTEDILASLDGLVGSGIETLEIDPTYYDEVFERVPHVREDPARIQAHQVLVDGDDDGYLLQIFTRNLIGPIFIEIIQRANNLGFGEGNFGALFRSIERDQERRGVI